MGGQLDPEGRIAITTFRGLPKPGELTVELRAAIESARQEAQAPLATEEIPLRYREGIRTYFEGLGAPQDAVAPKPGSGEKK
ncbi:MAG: hypothetical protein HMLKMBBP_01887 [Planctomycetes bacterium]|nr:hypothetical protein [Planctomycetota bacterium]